jgi:hypothetical protein
MHSTRRRLVAGLLLAGLSAAAAGDGSTASRGSLCAADEVTVFACPSRGKQIAVCASRGWTPESGWVQYRFGTAKRIEVAVPSTFVRPADGVSVAQRPIARGGFAVAAFRADRYIYTVYSAISGAWGEKAGVVVDRDDVRIATRRCDRGKEGEFAEGFLDRPGLTEASRDFLLPG